MEQTVKKYYAFHPAKNGPVTFGLERMADIEAEIYPMHVEHYKETESYTGVPPNFSYDRYKASEEAGQFVLFTARVGDVLAGHLCYYIFDDMHMNMKVAREDAFFIRKQFRGKKLGGSLMSYAEDALRQLGCKMVGMTSKVYVGGADTGPSLIKRGYKETAMYYTKMLKEK